MFVCKTKFRPWIVGRFFVSLQGFQSQENTKTSVHRLIKCRKLLCETEAINSMK